MKTAWIPNAVRYHRVSGERAIAKILSSNFSFHSSWTQFESLKRQKTASSFPRSADLYHLTASPTPRPDNAANACLNLNQHFLFVRLVIPAIKSSSSSFGIRIGIFKPDYYTVVVEVIFRDMNTRFII